MSTIECIRVASGDTDLAVWVRGRGKPCILMVHGYPDDHRVWDPVAGRLEQRCRVATLDLRGFGESSPPGAAGFSYGALARDIAAVVAELGGSVHLVGHDWGSIIGWLAVTDPGASAGIRSFTSISGPHPALYRHWIAQSLRGGVGAGLGATRQLLRSWYGIAFQVPGVAEALMERMPAAGWRGMLRASGVPPGDPMFDEPIEAVRARMRGGVGLYRNAARESVAVPTAGSIHIPVQVIVPVADRFLGPDVLVHNLGGVVADAFVRRVQAGHWPMRSHPDLLAGWIEDVVISAESDVTPVTLARCRVPDPGAEGRSREFEDKVVLITGAGSGIGRATALAFAEGGAELVLADIDKPGADRTAELALDLGSPQADVYEVDVSDRDAMLAFAAAVHAARGAVDILVNNAGIGIGGAFLDHDLEDWDRIVGVNLMGVVHGCHVFGAEMARSGRGGHVVNISSLAGLVPTPSLSAYSATKFGVLGLSEALRAEWARHGVGVSAICPGVINTPIVETSRLAGEDGETPDRLRELTVDLFSRFGHDPDLVAEGILDAVRNDIAVRPVGPEVYVLREVMRFAPDALRRFATRAVPGETSV